MTISLWNSVSLPSHFLCSADSSPRIGPSVIGFGSMVFITVADQKEAA